MATSRKDNPLNTGRIVRVIGPVIDVEFGPDTMPAIYNALRVEADSPIGRINLVAEVQQHLVGNQVRAVAMSSTDGVTRGMEAVDTGRNMMMPVGPSTLGRIFNVLGEVIDGGEPVVAEDLYPIHREAPAYEDLESKTEIFETGIKVVDLLEPYIKGGKTRP